VCARERESDERKSKRKRERVREGEKERERDRERERETLLSDCIGNFPLQRIPSSSQPLSCVQSEKNVSSLL
jgi:hypothetical protein